MTNRKLQLALKLAGAVCLALASFYAVDGLLRGRRPVPVRAPVLWRDPGDVAALDLALGPGGAEGAPRPPFTFVEEDAEGHSTKVKVIDGAGVRWSVKFGEEVHSEIVATRLAWAAGYFVEPAYYVATGRIEGARDLARAATFIGPDGAFSGARFERKDYARSHQNEESWSLSHNPFVGTRELAGLKVVVMLTSNWDVKDVREGRVGSNTAVLEYATPGGVEARYVISDWGASLGRWGGPLLGTKWDCDGYSEQGPELVTAEGSELRWGYRGFHTDEIASGVTRVDVGWLMQYLGRVTDAQIRTALEASGARSAEADCFASAIRARLERLREIGQAQP